MHQIETEIIGGRVTAQMFNPALEVVSAFDLRCQLHE